MNYKQIRWTMEHAASEFGINPRTLSMRLKQLNIVPGDDDYYGTKEIASAIYGDLTREKIGLTCAERIAQEMKNAEEAGALIDVEIFKKDYASIYIEMVRIIRNSKLAVNEQDELLTTMAKLHQ